VSQGELRQMESVSPAFLRCVIMPVSGRKWKSDSLAAGRRPMCSRWAGDPRPGPSTFAVPNAVGGGGGAAGGMPAAGTGPMESISGKKHNLYRKVRCNSQWTNPCGVLGRQVNNWIKPVSSKHRRVQEGGTAQRARQSPAVGRRE
jgi:hypothetical protein